jgi:non-specific serine/threonine protein kinase
VFAGGWTIEAAEAVCSDDATADEGDTGKLEEISGNQGQDDSRKDGMADEGRQPPFVVVHPSSPSSPSMLRSLFEVSSEDVLDLLTRLVDKSLVVLDEQAAAPRYRMLETVRQYASEKLLDAGEGEAIRTRHRAFFARFAAEATPHLYEAEPMAWLARFEVEHENLRSAIEWFTAKDDPVIPLQLAADLFLFWYIHGYHSEGLEHMRQVLARAQGSAMSKSVARARILLEINLSELLWAQKKIEEAKPLMDDALVLAERFGIVEHLPEIYRKLGQMALEAKDFAATREWLGRALESAHASPDNIFFGSLYWTMGDEAYYSGDYARARSYYQRGRTALQGRGDQSRVAYLLRRLGYIALAERQLAEAEALIRESLRINLDLMERQGLIGCIAALAALCGTQGQWGRAASLFASVENLLQTMHATLLPIDQADVQRNLALTRAALAPADFEAASSEGRALTLDEAIALALDDRHV